LSEESADVERLVGSGAILREKQGLVFCGPGVVRMNGSLAVVLPRVYDDMPRDTQQASRLVRTLVGVLNKYRKHRVDDYGEILNVGEVGEEGFIARLQAALELIDDEANNGALVVAERQRSSTGRIDWTNTIRSHPPVGHPRNEVFAGVIAHRVRPNVHHPITAQFRQSVSAARQFVDGHQMEPEADRVALRLLDVFGPQMYSDRQKRSASLMRRLHAGRLGERVVGSMNCSCSVLSRFEYLWEQILCVSLGPLHSVELPKGVYREPAESHSLVQGNGSVTGARWRPDMVLTSGGRLYILDGKDYAPGSYPATESISKQMLYRLMLCREYEPTSPYDFHQTRNAFVFPTQDRKSVV
jgi:hypothetical protein